MELELRINGIVKSLDVAFNESLMTALRREGYFSVKHGCETGECGACRVPGICTEAPPIARSVCRIGCGAMRVLYAGHAALCLCPAARESSPNRRGGA